MSHFGRPVADTTLLAALRRALDARDAAVREVTPARHATWFDVVTAAALSSFAEAGLDWVVVEVGMGGRLESTDALANAQGNRVGAGRESAGTVRQSARKACDLDSMHHPVIQAMN